MVDFPRVGRFQRGDSIARQAQRVWLALIAQAVMKKGQTLTYGALAEHLGYDPRAGRTLSRPLGLVGDICVRNGLAALNAIVVNAETGTPGDHVVLSKGRSVEAEQRAVWEEEWFAVRVPTANAFRLVAEIQRREEG